MTQFSFQQALEILERTPRVLEELLAGLSPDWIMQNEGEGTWNSFDVVGHLLHGDKTDWLARAEIILSESEDKKFAPFDRFAQFEESKGKSLQQLLDEFKEVRKGNITRLKEFNITSDRLSKTGIHPAFGEVTLSQLISAWVVHDLDHISQIARVMAKRYGNDTGPWIEYLKILKQ